MNFFTEPLLTDFEKHGFQRRQIGWWEDALGIWDENATKLGCDDHCTTINVVTVID